MFRRDLCHKFTQVRLFKAVGINAADKAVGVTRRLQIDRRGARLQQRPVVVRLVVVAVEQHQIPWGQQGVKDDFIG